MGKAGKSGGGVRASVSAAASAMPPAKSGRTAVHAHSSAPGNEGEAPPDQVHHRHAEYHPYVGIEGGRGPGRLALGQGRHGIGHGALFLSASLPAARSYNRTDGGDSMGLDDGARRGGPGALGLDPLGEEAQKAHEGVIRHVLQSGTKVSLLVRSHKPSKRCYTIERSVPNPPVVKDEAGEVLTLSPRDVMPGVEVFGQHEISELTKSPEKLTLLLERFVDWDPTLSGRKSQVRLELERSRSRIVDVRRELQRLDERLAALPGLEETQKRFQQAGLEERLKEKSLLVREERLFSNLEERLDQYRALHNELTKGLPVDTAFVSSKVLEGLPNSDILSEIQGILRTLSTKLETLGEQFGKSLAETDHAIAQTKSRWNERKTAIEETYEKLLRELQKSKIDGAEFIQLRQQIEELRPLNDKMERLKRDLEAHEAQRRNLLAEWEDTKAAEYRQVETAAKRVSRKLRDRVQVRVTMAGNRDPLERLLREIGGNLAAALDRLRGHDQLSLPELALRCREGKEALKKHYNLPSGAAERIAQADLDLFHAYRRARIACDNGDPVKTPLPTGNRPIGRRFKRSRPAKRQQPSCCSCCLNRKRRLSSISLKTISTTASSRRAWCRSCGRKKRRRQFVFSTHNANIPVLGDAELIVGLAASGEAREGQARIAPRHMASIDSRPVRELVEEILEGGKAAFEMRRSKYGF